MECMSVCRHLTCSKRSGAFNIQRQLLGNSPAAHITSAKGGIARIRSPHRVNLDKKVVFGVRLPVLSNRHFVLKNHGNLRVSATASPMDVDDGAPGESGGVETKTMTDSVFDWLDALHRFSRPHTVIGSALGIVSVSLLALQSPSELSSKFFIGLLQAVIPALFMNIYIVGLNQIYDVDIDKVNKPYLPLASGEYSMGMGVAIVTISAILSLAIGAAVGSRPLLWALLVSLVLGTAYSVDVPFLRWKRSALAAATCILAVRAIVVQMGFYFHMQSFVFGRAAVMTKPLLFATAFMSFYSIVIALAKDMPDVEGDRIYGIRSFSVRAGLPKIFWLCVWLIQASYAVAIGVGVTNPFLWGKASMILGHACLGAILWKRANAVDLKSKAAITSFYMFIWQLFYAEYLILPFVR
ncbi:hypothetical protein R1flu_010244 [Riccia fluitans]|uniref:Uncharacterized protein n=1 Tax=Riccia fluitans TaxID=41844 RepID=A0ABD1Z4F5_9MARC